VRQRVRARDRETLLLLYWLLLPLAVFFLARSRLQLYVLPLFVPLALMSARALAASTWLARGRLLKVAGATAAVLLALKGAAAYVPSDRNAREMADQVRRAVDLEGIEEIAFIDMRAFFGLTLYLDIRAESVRIGGDSRPHATLLPTQEDLCAELGEQERDLYALKRRAARQFGVSVAACGQYAVTEVGSFHGDGHEIVLFTVRPAPATPPG
jgi:4-amino-4-deoxy-L-arabinose transferase